MFSTLIADNAVQPSHVLSKTPVEMLDGFQLENTSAEKSVSDEQFCQARLALCMLGSRESNFVSELQPTHDRTTLEAKGSGVSKTISDVQVSHARNALPTKGSSELKLVRL